MSASFPVKHLTQDGAVLNQQLLHDGSDWTPHGVFDYIETEGQVSNTSSVTPVTAQTLVTPNLPAGDYEIAWQFSFRHSVVNDNLDVRVFLSGGPDVMPPQDWTCTDSSSEQRWPGIGARRMTLSGVNTIIMEFLNDQGAGTAYMYNRRMCFRPIDDTGVPPAVVAGYQPRLKNLAQSGALDNQFLQWQDDVSAWVPNGFTGEGRSFSRSTTTSSTYQQKMRYSTPANFPAGIYMVKSGFTWDRANASGDAGFRLQLNDSLTVEERTIESPSGDSTMRQSCATFRVLSLASGVNDFDIDFKDFNNLTATVGISQAYVSLERVGFSGGG